MANKKVSQLVSKPSVLVTDLFPIADPTTGQLFKTTISALGTAIGSGVSSVNTLVGAVVLDTDDIQELASPTNRWFTDTRARAALSASSPLAYNSGTGVFSLPQANGSTNGFLSSADWTTFNAKQPALSGTGFVKISGTTISYDNSTYLTTSAAASTYLALSGGTLTGALNGTSATFTGDLTLSATNPRLYFTDTDNNPDYFISNTDGTFTIYDVTNNTSRFTIGTTGNGTFGGNLTVGQIIRSGGTSSQFLKADGSVDSSTYLTTGTASSTYLPLSGGTLTGNLFLPANNTIGGTNNYIGQTMADNDYWRIYGNTVASDQGELVFHLGDNASAWATVGQRFRFFVDNASSGTAKSLLTIDYDTAVFTTSLSATTATFSGKVLTTASGNDTFGFQMYKSGSTTTIAGFYQNTTGDGLIAAYNSAGTQNVQIATNGVSYFNGGNVGIGTTAPTVAAGMGLVINGGATSPRIALKNNASGDASTDGFQLVLTTENEAVLENRENASMRFLTNATEAMRITSSGNVGIGTTLPQQKLDVVGNVRLIQTGITDITSVWTENNVGSVNQIRVFGTSVTGTQFGVNRAGYSSVDTNNGLGLLFGTTDNAPIIIGTNNTERMRITSSGNVLIGTTSDGGSKLRVNGRLKIDGGVTNITNNSQTTIYSSIPVYSDIIFSVKISWDSNANAQQSYLIYAGAVDTAWGTPNSGITTIQSINWAQGYAGGTPTFAITGSGTSRNLAVTMSNASTYNVNVRVSIISLN